MTKEQIEQIEYSYSHSDDMVFQIEERVFVAETVLKHRKDGTVEMVGAQEVDETCFDGDEYHGDVLSKTQTIILADPYADNPNLVASYYYKDEVKEII